MSHTNLIQDKNDSIFANESCDPIQDNTSTVTWTKHNRYVFLFECDLTCEKRWFEIAKTKAYNERTQAIKEGFSI